MEGSDPSSTGIERWIAQRRGALEGNPTEFARGYESCLDDIEEQLPDGHSFVEKINEFERGFQYPEDIQNDPEFWLEHVHQQIDEAQESYDEGDREHMVVEFGDAILVCWRAMQVFGDEPPEKILSDRMDLNLDEKGYEAIMEKYTEWWRSQQAGSETNCAVSTESEQ